MKALVVEKGGKLIVASLIIDGVYIINDDSLLKEADKNFGEMEEGMVRHVALWFGNMVENRGMPTQRSGWPGTFESVATWARPHWDWTAVAASIWGMTCSSHRPNPPMLGVEI